MEFTRNIEFNTNPTVGQDLTITYNGFLSKSQEVDIVYGYGDSWENTTQVKMINNENGFVATINLQNYDTFNFCFKNSNNEWDNNSYCNYITPITPATENVQSFDIDSLIEELLEPIVNIEPVQEQKLELITEQEENFDLGYQLSNIISNIDESSIELVEYSTLDEILTATKIENPEELILENTSDIDLEDNYTENIISEISEPINNSVQEEIFNDIKVNDYEKITTSEFSENISEITSEQQNNSDKVVLIEPFDDGNETSPQPANTSLIVSSRKLNKFYLFRKRIKLALYKTFIKLPKLLLGLDEKE